MKNKKLIACSSVALLSFLGIIPGQQVTEDKITVNNSVKVSAEPAKLPVLELKAVNSLYTAIEREISQLKSLGKKTTVSLDENRLVAPNLYKIIKEIVDGFVVKAKIEMPKIFLYVGEDSKTYNASAQSSKIIHTMMTKTTYKKHVETKIDKKVETHHDLVLGEGTVRLLLWKNYGNKLLSAIIGHEVGHMCDSNAVESKRAEYFADSKAVEFLGKRDAKFLEQAIDMITLATHIYNILISNSVLLRLNVGDSHQVIRIITNSIVNELPELGDLGKCSTHKKFGHVVNKIFQDSLKYSLDPKIGLTEKEFINIYQRLQKACTSLSDYMGDEEEQEISQKYEFIENYTNQIYNHITHPTPLERSANIEKCIARLA